MGEQVRGGHEIVSDMGVCRPEGRPRLTFFSLDQGIYVHYLVWSRVRFPGTQRHTPHPKLRGVREGGEGVLLSVTLCAALWRVFGDFLASNEIVTMPLCDMMSTRWRRSFTIFALGVSTKVFGAKHATLIKISWSTVSELFELNFSCKNTGPEVEFSQTIKVTVRAGGRAVLARYFGHTCALRFAAVSERGCFCHEKCIKDWNKTWKT